MTSIHLFAEHLLNLRQVTVFATLSHPTDDRTRVQLSTSGQTLMIFHDGIEDTIDLPCAVSRSLNPIVPKHATKELSFRFEALQSNSSSLSLTNDDQIWTAPGLAAGMQVSCTQCKHPLVENVNEWKDLPSGGWADMMDFWHCHKPDVPNGVANTAGKAKSYAADGTLGPTNGCGLVDASSFLFLIDNCTGVKVCCYSSRVLHNYLYILFLGSKKATCL